MSQDDVRIEIYDWGSNCALPPKADNDWFTLQNSINQLFKQSSFSGYQFGLRENNMP